ncbi:hypothetical protein [Bacillus pumilus]|uniref:hypothetical protein n=1 Tax=Bacillus pumilus TaxID=1408 RepID=UPI002852678B|nr:hypothetical protein [Bacillus pumilus]MDF9458010.1 hypothetical protein [Bacillus pumilus]
MKRPTNDFPPAINIINIQKLTELQYEGALYREDDPADFYRPTTIKAVRVG